MSDTIPADAHTNQPLTEETKNPVLPKMRKDNLNISSDNSTDSDNSRINFINKNKKKAKSLRRGSTISRPVQQQLSRFSLHQGQLMQRNTGRASILLHRI